MTGLSQRSKDTFRDDLHADWADDARREMEDADRPVYCPRCHARLLDPDAAPESGLCGFCIEEKAA